MPAIPPQVLFHKTCPAKGRTAPRVLRPLKLALELGDLSKKPPETFTLLPAGKRGEHKKAGPPAWEKQTGNPALGRREPWTSTVRMA